MNQLSTLRPIRTGCARARRWPALAFVPALLLLTLAACGTTFVEVHPTQPLRVDAPGALKVDVHRLLLTEDVPWGGLREDTALVVELDLVNSSTVPRDFNITSLTCLLELDVEAPQTTLSLPLGAGAAGTFPGEVGEDLLETKPLTLPPGSTLRIWALFRGYKYPGSDIQRRVVLTFPGPDGRPMRLVLADPARGTLRWTLPARKSSVMLGLDSISLLGGTAKMTGLASEITFLRRQGRVLLDVDLTSAMLVQIQGSLTSPTSSFAGSGLAAHVAYPLLEWGPDHDPRRLGLFAGGQGQLLVSLDPPPPPDGKPMPHVYGVLSVDAGLDIEVGALGPALGPFPITPTGTPLPRWFIRLGYTQWFVNGGTAAGYTSSFRLAW
jgi:hypothetical protein